MTIPDVQNRPDDRGIALDEVGITAAAAPADDVAEGAGLTVGDPPEDAPGHAGAGLASACNGRPITQTR